MLLPNIMVEVGIRVLFPILAIHVSSVLVVSLTEDPKGGNLLKYMLLIRLFLSLSKSFEGLVFFFLEGLCSFIKRSYNHLLICRFDADLWKNSTIGSFLFMFPVSALLLLG